VALHHFTVRIDRLGIHSVWLPANVTSLAVKVSCCVR
jgi:hypothetical protein